jgi:hypothetical protein
VTGYLSLFLGLHDSAASASEVSPKLIVPVDDLGLILDVFPIPPIPFCRLNLSVFAPSKHPIGSDGCQLL